MPSITEIRMRRAEAVPEVRVDEAGQAGAAELVGAGRGELTTTPVGVRASFHSTNTRPWPCLSSPRFSPTYFVPRSSSTTLPSAL